MSVLAIIRNISFEVSNVPVLAYSTNLLIHLLSISVNVLVSGLLCDAGRLTFDILCNIGYKIDISTLKKHHYYLYMNDILRARRSSMDKDIIPFESKRENIVDVANDRVMYSIVCKALLSTYFNILGGAKFDRTLTLRVLDVLCQFGQVAENGIVLDQIPRKFSQILSDLVYCSITSSDPFRSTIQVNCSDNTVIHRIPPAIQSATDADLVDTEVRVVALATILSLCTNSSQLQFEFGANNVRFVEYLCNIVNSATLSGPGSSYSGISFIAYNCPF